MTPLLYVELAAFWAVWWYPFLFRAPHFQNRHSIVARRPTMAGLILEVIGIGVAFAVEMPPSVPRSPLRIVLSVLFGVSAVVLAWTSVTHLGRQFRITAGLYEDHQLVTSGPYAVVRHPIYSSLFAMMLCSAAVLTPVKWAVVAAVIFIAGTEIRVRTEDGLLASRFGDSFRRYRNSVSAYVPFVR